MTAYYAKAQTVERPTPQAVFDKIAARFGPFDLDPAATFENAKCEAYYDEAHDGLMLPWYGRVFCNPPYGRGLGAWVAKAVLEVSNGDAEIVVMLLPAYTDRKWWHEIVMQHAHKVFFGKGRITFEGTESGAPFPSALVVFLADGYPRPEFDTWEW